MSTPHPKTLADEAFDEYSRLAPTDRDKLRELASRLSKGSLAATADVPIRIIRSMVHGMLGDRLAAETDVMAAFTLRRNATVQQHGNLLSALVSVGRFTEAVLIARELAEMANAGADAVDIETISLTAIHAGDEELLRIAAALEARFSAPDRLATWTSIWLADGNQLDAWVEHQRLVREFLRDKICRVAIAVDDQGSRTELIFEYWTTLPRGERDAILRRVDEAMIDWHRARNEEDLPSLAYLGLLIEQLPVPSLQAVS